MGRVSPIMTSTKKKLNTCSSTESEIVGVHDYMPYVCWTRYFMEAQVYQVMDFFKTETTRENNGKLSSSKLTKHINIRFFFITDCISNK